ncbi:uncharacterized protein HMPREF1541_08371 [Cyphellophora europaea CBS 101466]|uniref:Uncharacterized protein n=1 Tax=Cyphellophora europaea (strain CBS 101466) TaxID=1220924 RepID=W2RM69_CYPE1|nr:uncharacterized protein HMPREF1541_08371 [Cyphellophora europaea CBS 101466]ETN37380.1 hypothetical protein HMPREF1541_08371 [Cyphellophora europaea CBS 101466]
MQPSIDNSLVHETEPSPPGSASSTLVHPPSSPRAISPDLPPLSPFTSPTSPSPSPPWASPTNPSTPSPATSSRFSTRPSSLDADSPCFECRDKQWYTDHLTASVANLTIATSAERQKEVRLLAEKLSACCVEFENLWKCYKRCCNERNREREEVWVRGVKILQQEALIAELKEEIARLRGLEVGKLGDWVEGGKEKLESDR